MDLQTYIQTGGGRMIKWKLCDGEEYRCSVCGAVIKHDLYAVNDMDFCEKCMKDRHLIRLVRRSDAEEIQKGGLDD